MEFYPNIITIGIWLVSIILCLIGLIKLLAKKLSLTQKLLPILLLLIPISDLTFGLTNKIRDGIKGEIVLSAIDDSFATTKSIVIREKSGKLNGEYDYSVAGFGELEKAKIKILNDSTLRFELTEREYSERLTFDKKNQSLQNKEKNINLLNIKKRIIEIKYVAQHPLASSLGRYAI